MRHATYAILIAALALAGGCGTMDLPDNFVAVEDRDLGPYEVRGVSADGMVIAARREDNAENGTLEFWAEAIKRELTGRGYTLTGSDAVESDGGTPGTLMTFTAQRGGRPYTYLAAVFVTKGTFSDGEVLIAEAGGLTEAMDPRRDDIRTALLSVR